MWGGCDTKVLPTPDLYPPPPPHTLFHTLPAHTPGQSQNTQVSTPRCTKDHRRFPSGASCCWGCVCVCGGEGGGALFWLQRKRGERHNEEDLSVVICLFFPSWRTDDTSSIIFFSGSNKIIFFLLLHFVSKYCSSCATISG